MLFKIGAHLKRIVVRKLVNLSLRVLFGFLVSRKHALLTIASKNVFWW